MGALPASRRAELILATSAAKTGAETEVPANRVGSPKSKPAKFCPVALTSGYPRPPLWLLSVLDFQATRELTGCRCPKCASRSV